VGTIVTGVVERLSGISRNGVISMECVALASQTPRTSMRSHRLRCTFSDLVLKSDPLLYAFYFVYATQTQISFNVKFLVQILYVSLECDTFFHLFTFFFQEAQELWKRIQARQGVNKWRPDLEEEYEDKEGNIYNKKTYTDLQRQGLI